MLNFHENLQLWQIAQPQLFLILIFLSHTSNIHVRISLSFSPPPPSLSLTHSHSCTASYIDMPLWSRAKQGISTPSSLRLSNTLCLSLTIVISTSESTSLSPPPSSPLSLSLSLTLTHSIILRHATVVTRKTRHRNALLDAARHNGTQLKLGVQSQRYGNGGFSCARTRYDDA